MVLIPTGVYWKNCVRIGFGEKGRLAGEQRTPAGISHLPYRKFSLGAMRASRLEMP